MIAFRRASFGGLSREATKIGDPTARAGSPVSMRLFRAGRRGCLLLEC
jgi:hypothetical protein